MKIGSCKNVIIFTAMMLMIMYIFKKKMITMCMEESQWEVWAKGRAEVISMIDWAPCACGEGSKAPLSHHHHPAWVQDILLSSSCSSDSSELSLWVGLFPQWTLMISLDSGWANLAFGQNCQHSWKVIWSSGAGAFLNSCSTHNLLSAFTARGWHQDLWESEHQHQESKY